MALRGQNQPVEQILDTIPKAAERLTKGLGQHVGVYKVRAMLGEGQIDSVMLGREKMVSIASIERFIDTVMDRRVRRAEPAAAKVPAAAAAE